LNKVEIESILSDSDIDDSASESSEQEQGIEEENNVGFVKKRTFSVDLGNSTEDNKKLRG
jgi:hypothetical protein